MESHDQQQVHGVVIITFPPSDDPSQGKTISAFTLTDHHHYPIQIQPEDDPSPAFQPDPFRQNPDSNLWFADLSLGSPRLVLSLLGISLLAIAFYGSVFPDSVQMFRVSEERDRDEDRGTETTSFIFPVYHKLRPREFPERNLAQVLGVVENGFVKSIDQELVNPEKVNDVLSATVPSTSIFPVGGNVYPDGFYFTRILVRNPEDGHYFHLVLILEVT